MKISVFGGIQHQQEELGKQKVPKGPALSVFTGSYSLELFLGWKEGREPPC